MRKALPLALAALFFTTLAAAQITKGSVLLGGNIGFGNSKNNLGYLTKSKDFYFNPVAGVAIKQNLVAGITGLYNHSSITSDFSNATNKSTVSGAGIFLRRYFPVAKKFYLFGESAISYNHLYQTNKKDASNRATTKANNIIISVEPGLAYAVSKKFHLELGLDNLARFTVGKYKSKNTINGVQTNTKGDSFTFDTRLSSASPLNIGFRIFLSK